MLLIQISSTIDSFEREMMTKSGKITLSLGDYTDNENKRSASPVKV